MRYVMIACAFVLAAVVFADDAELVDQILAGVMEDRRRCIAGRMGERDGKKR